MNTKRSSRNDGPLSLIIMDGFARNPNPRGNAVFHARTPTIDRVCSRYVSTFLHCHGPFVGLPEGQMGNSEVGHLNIGGGRVVQQELTKINEAVKKGALTQNTALKSLACSVKSSPSAALHVMGLASNGGVHSSLDHAIALLEAMAELGVRRIYVHAITDGRDRPPTAAVEELPALVDAIEALRARYSDLDIALVSICGRYYAMDRDKRWDRTALAYDLYTRGKGTPFESWKGAITSEYGRDTTDEFLPPLITAKAFERPPTIQTGDSLLLFNFRADRMRQIIHALLPETPGASFNSFERVEKPQLAKIATLTEYEKGLPVDLIFPPMTVPNHFGAAVASAGLTQLRIAETEKYPHVTYFFNGGVEEPCRGEERILVPSPRDVPTYDFKPEMSAAGVTEQLVAKIRAQAFDVYVVNFANCDMVGHTGSFDAAVKAVEVVDRAVGEVLSALSEVGGTALITADHGNADQMIDYETGTPHTFHTMYPVPLFVVGRPETQRPLRSGGALCDIAPTALELIGIEKPSEMTGTSLYRF